MEEVALLGAVKDLWRNSPKDQVHIVEFESGKKAVRLATAINHLQVVLQVVIGERKGLAEWLMAIDPTQRIELDQLRVMAVRTQGDGYFLPMTDMRSKVRAGRDPVQVVGLALEGLLNRIRADPDRYAVFVERARDESSASIPTVSGGLPSLGKRR